MVSAFTDQAEAAERETALMLDRLAAAPGMAKSSCEPPSVAAIRRRFGLAVLGGRLRRCAHVRLESPAPMFATLDAPNELACERCLRAWLSERAALVGTDADHTCDGCERVVPELHHVAFGLGNVIFLGSLCPECYGG
jgi:hypothetical protein